MPVLIILTNHPAAREGQVKLWPQRAFAPREIRWFDSARSAQEAQRWLEIFPWAHCSADAHDLRGLLKASVLGRAER